MTCPEQAIGVKFNMDVRVPKEFLLRVLQRDKENINLKTFLPNKS